MEKGEGKREGNNCLVAWEDREERKITERENGNTSRREGEGEGEGG